MIFIPDWPHNCGFSVALGIFISFKLCYIKEIPNQNFKYHVQ